MGYTNHVKKTLEGLRYRVWSSITDTYISGEMTEAELREFELERQVRRSVQIIWGKMDEDIANATQVKKWKREIQKFDHLTDEQYAKMLDREASQIGAKVELNMQKKNDGRKILTIKIKPVPKRSI